MSVKGLELKMFYSFKKWLLKNNFILGALKTQALRSEEGHDLVLAQMISGLMREMDVETCN